MKWIGTSHALQDVAVVDFETTGIIEHKDEIVEIGVDRLENWKTVRTMSTLVKPSVEEVPPKATKTHGLTISDLRDAPAFPDVADELAEITEGCVIFAHRLPFEGLLWAAECKRAGLPAPPRYGFCTKVLVQAVRESTGMELKGGLEAILKELRIDTPDDPSGRGGFHSALFDARCTSLLARKLLMMLNGAKNAEPQHEYVALSRLGKCWSSPTQEHQKFFKDVYLPHQRYNGA